MPECQVTKDEATYGWFVNKDRKRVRLVVELVVVMLIMTTILWLYYKNNKLSVMLMKVVIKSFCDIASNVRRTSITTNERT